MTNTNPLFFKFRPLLWRWHRRIGAVAAALFVLIAATGFTLNHTVELDLDQRPVRAEYLLSLYGVKPPTVVSHQQGELFVSGDSQGYLYLNSTQSAYCNGTLKGVSEQQGMLIVGCEREIVLLSPEGDLIEHLGSSYGLPFPIEKIGRCAGQPCQRSGGVNYLMDYNQLSATPTEEEGNWSQAVALPRELREAIFRSAIGSELNWERVMQDLHSGRLFGPLGVVIYDLAALAFALLSLSGFLLWYQQVRRKH